MPYIGKSSDGFGIRERYRYSASGSQTAFTGSDLDSKTLQIDSGSLVDVYLNGVLLDTADYNTSTANTVTLTSGATASDEVMIVVYDVFSLSDAMPKTGGTFTGAVTHTGAFTSVGIDDNADATAITIDSSERVGVANTSPLVKLDVTGSNSPPPTSGTSQTGSLRLGQGAGNGVVDMGFDTTNTQGWIQATNKANLATNYKLTLNPNGGAVTIPKQPCFRARRTNTAGTTQGFQGNIIFDSKTLDLGNNYTTSNGRFTAPVDGTYYFSHAGLGSSGTGASIHSSGASWHLEFLKNGSRTGFQFYHYANNPTAGGTQSEYVNAYVDMVITLSAGDYITIQLPDGTDSYYSDTSTYYDTYFQGFLIG